MGLNIVIPEGASQAYFLSVESAREVNAIRVNLGDGQLLETIQRANRRYSLETNFDISFWEQNGEWNTQYRFGDLTAKRMGPEDGVSMFKPVLEQLVNEGEMSGQKLVARDCPPPTLAGKKYNYRCEIALDMGTIALMSYSSTSSGHGLTLEFRGNITSEDQVAKLLPQYFEVIQGVIQRAYNHANLELDREIILSVPDASVADGRDPNDVVNLLALKKRALFSGDGTRFEDIIGNEDVKQYLVNIARAVQERVYEKFGIRPPSGILFYGPPGNGKTSLARALSGEVGFQFLHIHLPTILSSYHGKTAQNIEGVYRLAAQHPSVIYIDEIDALTRTRGGADHDFKAQLLGTLLNEMDGICRKEKPVLHLGSTNRPDLIDPAFLRPGRFTSHIKIPEPDPQKRRKVLLHYISKAMQQTEIDALFSDEIEVSAIVESTKGESCAYMEEVVRAAIEQKVFASLREEEQVPISGDDLVAASRLVASRRYSLEGRPAGFRVNT
ncbi:MAG TPA: ATP-binding protein [Candidatus Nanoarchaeia archaeon]|nr:ATP-binding protein [Candidatus Nanoarchaeia archaeon]